MKLLQTIGRPLPLLTALFLCWGCDQAPSSTEPGTSLKVMTYNLRYGDATLAESGSRKDTLLLSLGHHMPDVLGVQEANEPWMEILAQGLEEYAYVGVGRDDGIASGEFSAIFYRADRFEVVDQGTFWLSDTPDRPSFGWGANNRRICTWAYLRNLETGEVTAHFNTHLDHESLDARVNGIALILERIEQSPHPAILTGDLNFLEGSELYEALDDSNLTDAKFEADVMFPFATINWFATTEDTGVVIDFVFVEEGAFEVRKYEVDASWRHAGLPVSDHYPVIVELELRR